LKGQVTIFIILGMVLLVGAVVLINLFDKEVDVSVTDIRADTDFNAIVNSCLREIVPEALEIIRMQGGYIHIPEGTPTQGIASPQVVVDALDGTKSLKILQGFVETPYWLHGDGLFIPSLELMAEQMEKQIEVKIVTCTNGFESLVDDGFDVEEEE